MSKPNRKLARLVDELGALKAQLAELSRREEEIKSTLKATGLAVVEGNLFDASVSTCDREILDRASVEAVLAPEAFKKCLKTSTVTTVRVVARAKRASKREQVRVAA